MSGPAPPPSSLAKHHVIGWAIERGAHAYLLGGDRGLRDTLLRYKRHFAPHCEVPFQVACVVHDPAAYAELAARRAELAAGEGRLWSARDGFFPAYRAGVAS